MALWKNIKRMRILVSGDRVRIVGVPKDGEWDMGEDWVGKHGTVLEDVYQYGSYTGIRVRADGDNMGRIYPREGLRALPRKIKNAIING